jgi:putative ABC transport system substrate-binding protein
VFSVVPPSAEKGALFDVGADFFEIGKESGALAARVLKGADPAGIPWSNSVPRRTLERVMNFRQFQRRGI